MLTCHELPYTSIHKRIACNEISAYWEVDNMASYGRRYLEVYFVDNGIHVPVALECIFQGVQSMVIQYCAIKDVCPNLTLNSNLAKSRSSKIIRFNFQIVLIFFTEHDNNTAVQYVKFRNEWANRSIMCKWDFTRFGLKMSFGRIS